MMVIPGELAAIDIERYGRVGIERLAVSGLAAGAHPRLRLRNTPVGQIEIGIKAACDPGVAAGSKKARQLAPSVAAGLAFLGDGVKLPEQLAGPSVIGADETFFVAVLGTEVAAQTLDHLALCDEWAARGAVIAVGTVADNRIPDVVAGAGIERENVRLPGRDEHLVVINRQAALRVALRTVPDAVFPNKVAGASVERLHDVAGIVDEQDPVVDHRGDLVGSLVHGPHPLELKLLHVLGVDLVQRTIVIRMVIVPDHDPVTGIGIAEEGIGDISIVADFAPHGEPARRGHRAAGWYRLVRRGEQVRSPRRLIR